MALKEQFLERMCYSRCSNKDCKPTKPLIHSCATLVIWNTVYNLNQKEIKRIDFDQLYNDFEDKICEKKCLNSKCRRVERNIHYCATLLILDLLNK